VSAGPGRESTKARGTKRETVIVFKKNECFYKYFNIT
jgi:hypothetical protein